MKLYIIDAFSKEIFGGNPAGVVILEEGQPFPPEEIMIKVASELRYSETAFVKPIDSENFKIRYFTPNSEVDLCGHATIASFSALEKYGLVSQGNTYIIETLAGALNISLENNSIMMDMATPNFISQIDEIKELEELYEILGINYNPSLALFPAIISTGLPDIILPVKDKITLEKISPDFDVLTALSKKYNVVGVHAFALDTTSTVTAHCRNFAPLYEIDEEAATGTANGALTYYLHLNNLLPANGNCAFIQGVEMKRPSLISTQLRKKEDGKLLIRVGGTSAILAEGKLIL